jgi:hypothetical protein
MKSKARDIETGLRQLQRMPDEAKQCLSHVVNNGLQLILSMSEQILDAPRDEDRARALAIVDAVKYMSSEVRRMMEEPAPAPISHDDHLGALRHG